MSFTIHKGCLCRDGEPFIAIGVDYHPSRAGCRIWTDWDPGALRRDFQAIALAELNTVRLFVFWRDFEPSPGQYSQSALQRLREALSLAEAAGLAGVISLYTIWMNGQRLDLPWRDGRNLWLDEEMLARQEAFAAAVGDTLAGAGNLLAVDLGDEIANVAPQPGLTRETVAAWHARMAAVLRQRLPGTLVMQANDASAVFSASPFGVDNAANLDFVAVHGFPTWAPGSIESTLSYKATNLVPFLVRFAAAYGLPFVDELGSYGVSDGTSAAYLRASAASALANGAAGILVWCWQDIASDAEPYQQRPSERYVGLRRLDGTDKPALAELRRVAAAGLGGTAGRAPVAVYVPERERHDGGSYLDGPVGTLGTFYAYLLAKRAHLDVDIVATSLDRYRLVICPSVGQLTRTDLDRIRSGMDGGATVYYSMGDQLHGFPGADLAGVELVDFDLTATGKESIDWSGRPWPLDWGGATPVTVSAVAGQTVATYPDGTPAIQVNGRFVFCAAPFERLLDRPGRLTCHPWEQFYRAVAALASVKPVVDCPLPEVEIVPSGDGVLVVNHGTTPVATELTWTDTASVVPLRLDGKDWRRVDAP